MGTWVSRLAHLLVDTCRAAAPLAPSLPALPPPLPLPRGRNLVFDLPLPLTRFLSLPLPFPFLSGFTAMLLGKLFAMGTILDGLSLPSTFGALTHSLSLSGSNLGYCSSSGSSSKDVRLG